MLTYASVATWADGGCLRRVGRRRRVRDLDGPLDGRRCALPRPPQGGVLRGRHDPALRLGHRHPAQPRTCVNSNPIVSVDTSRGPYSGRVYVSYARTEFRGRQAAHIALFDPQLRRIAPDPDTREGGPWHRCLPLAGPTSSGRSRPSTSRAARCGCASTTRSGIPRASARSTRARSPATAAGLGARRYGRPPCRQTRRCPARSAITATTRASPPPAASRTRSGRTRASSPT